MPTHLERRLVQRKRSQGVLRPLLEDLFRSRVGIETEEDARWLYELAKKISVREDIRRNGNGVYSPSGLAQCLRRVYLSKNWKRLGLERIELPAVTPHAYFTEGEFRHLKWQFAFYKLAQSNPDFQLLDCEFPVVSKHLDHGGTIDALVVYKGELMPVDIKSMNVRNFKMVAMENTVHENYRIQIADYTMLLNSSLRRKRVDYPLPATRGILLAESKGGPDPFHPLAIHEVEIPLKQNLPEVNFRLRVLRDYEERDEIPPPECTSTKGISFEGCPFAEHCRPEVRRREREAARGDSGRPTVAVPRRSRR